MKNALKTFLVLPLLMVAGVFVLELRAAGGLRALEALLFFVFEPHVCVLRIYSICFAFIAIATLLLSGKRSQPSCITKQERK